MEKMKGDYHNECLYTFLFFKFQFYSLILFLYLDIDRDFVDKSYSPMMEIYSFLKSKFISQVKDQVITSFHIFFLPRYILFPYSS